MAQQTFSGVPGEFTAGEVLSSADQNLLRDYLIAQIKEGMTGDTGEILPMIMDLTNNRVELDSGGIKFSDATTQTTAAVTGVAFSGSTADGVVTFHNSSTAAVESTATYASNPQSRVVHQDRATRVRVGRFRDFGNQFPVRHAQHDRAAVRPDQQLPVGRRCRCRQVFSKWLHCRSDGTNPGGFLPHGRWCGNHRMACRHGRNSRGRRHRRHHRHSVAVLHLRLLPGRHIGEQNATNKICRY